MRSSPWRNGQGDVVGELAEACRDAGLGLGLYLSPWDRHDPDWERQPERYDARYIEQLIELCTNYGPLVELWFDGAGPEQRAYAWDDIMAVVEEHQPQAMIFNMGDPTIRWVGNEDGLASDPCWYAVSAVGTSIYDEAKVGLVGGERYVPPECDVPIRRHWFWQPDDLHTLKSVEHLQAIWYRSIGLGANLLLNVPRDRHARRSSWWSTRRSSPEFCLSCSCGAMRRRGRSIRESAAPPRQNGRTFAPLSACLALTCMAKFGTIACMRTHVRIAVIDHCAICSGVAQVGGPYSA